MLVQKILISSALGHNINCTPAFTSNVRLLHGKPLPRHNYHVVKDFSQLPAHPAFKSQPRVHQHHACQTAGVGGCEIVSVMIAVSRKHLKGSTDHDTEYRSPATTQTYPHNAPPILTECTRPLCAAERNSSLQPSSSEGRLVSSHHRLACWKDQRSTDTIAGGADWSDRPP